MLVVVSVRWYVRLVVSEGQYIKDSDKYIKIDKIKIEKKK